MMTFNLFIASFIKSNMSSDFELSNQLVRAIKTFIKQ